MDSKYWTLWNVANIRFVRRSVFSFFLLLNLSPLRKYIWFGWWLLGCYVKSWFCNLVRLTNSTSNWPRKLGLVTRVSRRSILRICFSNRATSILLIMKVLHQFEMYGNIMHFSDADPTSPGWPDWPWWMCFYVNLEWDFTKVIHPFMM